MYRGVIRQFGVERRDELAALPRGDDIAADDGEDFRAARNAFDIRRAYERHRDIADAFHFRGAGEAAELSAVSVAPHADVHRAEVDVRVVRDMLCEEYQPRAGTEHGHAAFDHSPHVGGHIQVAEQFAYDGGFAAGDHEPVERAGEIALLPDLGSLCAEAFQHTHMLDERAL